MSIKKQRKGSVPYLISFRIVTSSEQWFYAVVSFVSFFWKSNNKQSFKIEVLHLYEVAIL